MKPISGDSTSRLNELLRFEHAPDGVENFTLSFDQFGAA